MAHWLCIRVPHLPLELYTRSSSEQQPLAVSHNERRASILLCNAAAYRLGVRPGASVAAARALVHDLIVKRRDEGAEMRALDGLAAWAYQFSSQVSLYPPCELLLEVEGSFRLYGGRQSLFERLRTGLTGLGYMARLAAAPTPLAARSLAHCNREQNIESFSRLAEVLASLPVSVLDWPQVLLDRLEGIGVRRLGELFRLPRDGLARRFGEQHVLYLDRMLGRSPHPQQLYQPPAVFQRRLVLSAEVQQAQALLFALQRLLSEMCGWLQGLAAAVLDVTVVLSHRQQASTTLSIKVHRPSRNVDEFVTLLREHLDRLQLTEPVLEVELQAGALLPQAVESHFLFDQEAGDRQVNLLDRLRARLGDEAITGLSAIAEHRPEYAWQYSPPGCSTGRGQNRCRPLWLLAVPRRLSVVDGRPQLRGELRLAPGVERIESGWWDGGDVARDYYIATTAGGSVCWIYRELTGERGWYLQGVFE